MDGLDRFAHDAFYVDQLIRPVANLYRISTLGPDGASPGEALAFVRQKRLAIKEDIRFSADESEEAELFRLKARQVLELGGRYDVTTADGERLGTLEKRFAASLLRSTWVIRDGAETEQAVVRERSAPVALLRRLLEFVPYAEAIPIVFHFEILAGERRLGEFTRPWGIRDRYVLRLDGDPDRTIDRRVAVALAVALDALQSR